MTIIDTNALNHAHAERLIAAFLDAPYLGEVISLRALNKLDEIRLALEQDKPTGVTLISLRIEDPVLWSLGSAGRLPGLPDELTQRLARRRGVEDEIKNIQASK